MRAFAWAFIVCTVLAAVGVFVPSFAARPGGISLGRRTSLSLYQVATRKEVARRIVIAYHHGAKTRIGAAVVATLTPRLAGRLSSAFTDVGDAAKTLDGVSDDDVGTVGTALTVGVYVFLALHVVILGLMFGNTLEDSFRRRRIIAAVAVATIVAAAGVALHWASRTAVAEANDELGASVLELGAGSYLTMIAALAGLAAGIALLVLHVRAGRAATPAPG